MMMMMIFEVWSHVMMRGVSLNYPNKKASMKSH